MFRNLLIALTRKDTNMSKDFEKHKKEIEKIIARFKCPKDFECYKSGFKNLCKAKDIGLEKYLECLKKDPGDCVFSLSFGYSYLCKCPLRVYIAKNLKK
jgi:hypothetical protein